MSTEIEHNCTQRDSFIEINDLFLQPLTASQVGCSFVRVRPYQSPDGPNFRCMVSSAKAVQGIFEDFLLTWVAEGGAFTVQSKNVSYVFPPELNDGCWMDVRVLRKHLFGESGWGMTPQLPRYNSGVSCVKIVYPPSGDVRNYLCLLEIQPGEEKNKNAMPNFLATDPYEILGLSCHAKLLEIKARYDELAHQYHPDRPNGDTTLFVRISAAYHTLQDRLSLAPFQLPEQPHWQAIFQEALQYADSLQEKARRRTHIDSLPDAITAFRLLLRRVPFSPNAPEDQSLQFRVEKLFAFLGCLSSFCDFQRNLAAMQLSTCDSSVQERIAQIKEMIWRVKEQEDFLNAVSWAYGTTDLMTWSYLALSDIYAALFRALLEATSELGGGRDLVEQCQMAQSCFAALQEKQTDAYIRLNFETHEYVTTLDAFYQQQAARAQFAREDPLSSAGGEEHDASLPQSTPPPPQKKMELVGYREEEIDRTLFPQQIRALEENVQKNRGVVAALWQTLYSAMESSAV